jgi:hypothetical protein
LEIITWLQKTTAIDLDQPLSFVGKHLRFTGICRQLDRILGLADQSLMAPALLSTSVLKRLGGRGGSSLAPIRYSSQRAHGHAAAELAKPG